MLKIRFLKKRREIMKNDAAKIGGAFLLGGLIGGAIALLYAPKSGRATRKDISRAARHVKNDAVDLVEETIENINEFAGDVKQKVTDIIGQGANLSDKAKEEIAVTFEHGLRLVERQKKRLTDALGL